MLDIRFMFGAVIAGITVMVVMLVTASWMLGTGDASVTILGERPNLETAAGPRIEQEPARRIEAGPAQSIDPKAGLKSTEAVAIPPAMSEVIALDVKPAEPAVSAPDSTASTPPEAIKPEAIKPADIKSTEPKKSDSKIAVSKPTEFELVAAKPPVPDLDETQSAEPKDAPTAEETKPAAPKRAASKAAKPRRSEPARAGAAATQPEPADPSAGTGRSADQAPPSPDITGSIDPKPEPRAATPRPRRSTPRTVAAPRQPEIVNPFVQFFRDLEQLQQPVQQQRR